MLDSCGQWSLFLDTLLGFTDYAELLYLQRTFGELLSLPYLRAVGSLSRSVYSPALAQQMAIHSLVFPTLLYPISIFFHLNI